MILTQTITWSDFSSKHKRYIHDARRGNRKMTHNLKISTMYLSCVENGSKPFEARRTVSCILDDAEYCKNGFVVLGIRE